MPTVAVVRLRYVSKDYWFDPNGLELEEGDHVVVETARGKEIGLCVADCREVEEKDLAAPLKPVLRIATEKDLAQADEMNAKSEEALEVFKELVEEHGLDMKPVRVEFMFTGGFATFYFSADERIDFRSLVRDLASRFHVRVDMRQIGVRDEARMLGGLGHCGEELCCARLGGEFQQVSIRMAKEQDLPLNPSKISGACGRLMCCLRYEFEAYKDFKGRAPKKNAVIETPMGMAKVVEFDTPRERLRLRMEDGSSMIVPLSSMDTGGKEAKPGENIRPCHIGQEKWDELIAELNEDKNLALMGEKLFSDDAALADTLAEAGAVERTPRRRRSGGSQAKAKQAAPKKEKEPAARDQRKRRRSVSLSGEEIEPAQEAKPAAASKPKRRRRKKSSSSGSQQQGQQAQSQPKQQAKQGQAKPRPGQNSSTLHGDQQSSQQGGQAKQGSSSSRKRRRRRGSGSGSGGNKQQANSQGSNE